MLIGGDEGFGTSGPKKIGEVGKAFTLRLEYTSLEDISVSNLDVIADGLKLGRLVNRDTSDETRPAGYPQKAIRQFYFRSLCDGECSVYFDDVLFYYARRD